VRRDRLRKPITPGEELRGLPDLAVEGLRNGDAQALLGSVVPFVLDELVRARIVAETRGIHWAATLPPRRILRAQS
jgi:hypothetical protein